MILSLGQFVFKSDTLLFNELSRTRNYSYAKNDIAHGRERLQFTGVGDETISIPFAIFEASGLGKRAAVDELAQMASTGGGYVLIDGTGYLYGVFVIESIDDKRGYLLQNGAPQKIDGTLKLRRVDDKRITTDKGTL